MTAAAARWIYIDVADLLPWERVRRLDTLRMTVDGPGLIVGFNDGGPVIEVYRRADPPELIDADEYGWDRDLPVGRRVLAERWVKA